MRKFFIVASLAIAVLSGCDSGKSGGPSDTLAPATADVHEHATEGPHHGALVELGNEEYHAEVVHTQDAVTVYILAKDAKTAVPIEAADVTVNVVHDGKPEQFKLAASPDSGDSAGKSSRFTLADAELVTHIDDKAAAPKLSLMIDGKPYRGEIKHDHDHDHGHDHAHAH